MECAKGLLFRSKARWYELGERNNKYFFNMEKSRANQKTVTKVIVGENTYIEDSDILREQEAYYTELYRKDPTISYTIQNRSGISISDADYNMCDADFTENEILNAITSIKSGKTPGKDGLSIELYKLCWEELKLPFVRMLSYCYQTGEIHPNIKEGVLNLIPKANKDSRYLKNLRPIVLLNVDYKIIEKILALRIDKVLPGIINNDQTGFMAGRRISVNIRKVFDIMQYCKNTNKNGVLLNLDFVKCFDNISFNTIIGSLDYFNIPPLIRTWIYMLYTDFTIRVQNNGKFTNNIKVEKSVHQGGCISAQLFLLSAETIALELRDSKDITGIFIQDLEYLLNQYADDMSIASDYCQDSLNAIMEKLEWIRTNTGFAINYDKTTLIRMGSLENSCPRLYTQKNIAWTDGPLQCTRC